MSKARARTGRQVRIQSLARADAILEALAEAPKSGLRLRDIAAATALAPSTAVTLLQSLVGLRLAEQLPDSGTYRLGPRLLQLGRKVEARLDILELARPAVIRLCQQTHETVNLLVPGITTMIIAESLEGDVKLKTTPLKGSEMPLHGTASGKCFLAYAGAQIREAFLQAAPLTKLTARTISDLSRLEVGLSDIREAGYATEEDEFQAGVVALAAPILDNSGRIQGTISLHGPSERMTSRRWPRLVAALKTEARRISALLP